MRRLTVELHFERLNDGSRTTVKINGLPRLEPSQIFFEFSGPDAPTQAPNGNCAIAAALPLAMAHGGSLRFLGSADADFLETMEQFMAAWCRWRPDIFKPVALSAEQELSPELPKTRRAIMAFSGGLDSVCALHAHKHGLFGRRSFDIESAFLVQGFDLPLGDDAAFERANAHVKAMLDSYGVRFNIVRTNWKKDFAVDWQMTHTLGIAAVLHHYHHDFDCGVFADDIAFNAQLTPWSSNAITNQLLGCLRFPVRTASAEWERTEKAAIVAENPIVLEHIRVCYAKNGLGENCGRCEKCLRTKMNFYASGTKSVPALGAPLNIKEVRSRSIPPHVVSAYTDLLERGTWEESDPIRIVVAQMVDDVMGRAAGGESSVGKKNAFQLLEKKVRRSLRGLHTEYLARLQKRFFRRATFR